ncbi:short chain dehydrogenase [Paenalcaligenes hominis]|uniref:Short chain dehydrogenase n=1 Tax=Paenalcaligenes hominis TaxID=643674 RepID=A0A1U9K1E9_9BURK|nr:SDR family oxidoreductase [Paenalcaligenes hominis]AQS51832.1 short chain dehydrogenase [Paenalcaligenes hominis]
MTSRKTALVTGAAKRLGQHIALSLAQDGWDIALHYHQSQTDAEQTATTLRDLGVRCELFNADLNQPQAGLTLMQAVHERMGPIQALINNAARFEYDHAADFSAACLHQHLGANLIAPLELINALGTQKPQNEPVVAINLLDQKLWGYNPDFFSYTLCKAALKAATTMMAQALAPHVRVVGIAPGLTLPSHLQSAEDFERTHKMSLLGYGSRAEDICRTVHYILQTPSLTGSCIVVDAGQHLLGLQQDFSLL